MKAVHEETLLKSLHNLSETKDGLELLAWIEESRDDLLKASTHAGNDRDARITFGDKAQELSEILESIQNSGSELKTISRGIST